MTDNQRWRWTQYDQLQSIFNQTCLSVRETPVNWVRVKLSTCDPHDTYQVWTCVDDFVRLKGTVLNLNYGNSQGRDNVVLFDGIGSWSMWKVYGEDVHVCVWKTAARILKILNRDVMCCTLSSLQGTSFWHVHMLLIIENITLLCMLSINNVFYNYSKIYTEKNRQYSTTETINLLLHILPSGFSRLWNTI
jgi:hypothetical protein